MHTLTKEQQIISTFGKMYTGICLVSQKIMKPSKLLLRSWVPGGGSRTGFQERVPGGDSRRDFQEGVPGGVSEFLMTDQQGECILCIYTKRSLTIIYTS